MSVDGRLEGLEAWLHTCLPALRRFPCGSVINNGAAGLLNFSGTR